MVKQSNKNKVNKNKGKSVDRQSATPGTQNSITSFFSSGSNSTVPGPSQQNELYYDDQDVSPFCI